MKKIVYLILGNNICVKTVQCAEINNFVFQRETIIWRQIFYTEQASLSIVISISLLILETYWKCSVSFTKIYNFEFCLL